MRLEPLERRVDAIPGRTLVMPVRVQGPIDPRRAIRPLLDDGRALAAELHWIAVAPEPDGAGSWLPPAGLWSATPAAAHMRPAGTGAWCLVVPLPGDAIGQGLWFGSRRVPLNWLTDAALIVPPDEESPWVSPLTQVSGQLARLSEPEMRSPVRRWRHRLLTRGLVHPPWAAPGEVERDAPDEFSEPVLESLARQSEGRWRLALAALWRADPGLADQLKHRLVLTVEFPGGVVAPAWPCDQDALDELLLDLLNPRISASERVARTRAWLDEQPGGAGWVIDDAGAVDGITGRPIATCAAANLSDRRTLAWAAALPMRASPDMTPLEARTAAALQVSPPAPEGERAAAAVGVHVGRWSTTVRAVTEPLGARPPGLRIAPWFADWDLPHWLAGSGEPLVAPADAAGVWSATALVRPSDAAAAEAGAAAASAGTRWSLYVECRWAGATERAEVVRVWLGAFGRASRVLRVTSSGDFSSEGGDGVGATVVRREDRWIAMVPLPDECIEPGGVLRLGVERTDSRGRHSAWPRPMLPWQLEPGRAAVDLGAWDARAAGR